MPENHALAARASITAAELDGWDLIGFPRSIAPFAHDSIFGMIRRAGARPAVVQETDNWPAAVALAAAGVGLTIVPSSLCSLKPLDAILATAERKSLHRSLGALQLTLFGIDCIIGAGIFALTAVGAQSVIQDAATFMIELWRELGA